MHRVKVSHSKQSYVQNHAEGQPQLIVSPPDKELLVKAGKHNNSLNQRCFQELLICYEADPVAYSVMHLFFS